MTTQHTPGPWNTEKPYGEPGVYVSGLNTELVAKVWPDHLVTPVSEANARLIAASPDLLQACERALKVLESEPECKIYKAHIEIVRDAIAKAKGEPSE